MTTSLKDLKSIDTEFSITRIENTQGTRFDKQFDEVVNRMMLTTQRHEYNLPDKFNFRKEIVYKKKKKIELKDLQSLQKVKRYYKYGDINEERETHLNPYLDIKIPQINKFEKIDILNIEVDKKWKVIRIVDVDHMLSLKYKIISVKVKIYIRNEKEPVEYVVKLTYNKDDLFTMFDRTDKVEKGVTDIVVKNIMINETTELKLEKHVIYNLNHLYLLIGYKRPISYEYLEKEIHSEDFDKIRLVQTIQIQIKIMNYSYENKTNKKFEIVNNQGIWWD